jgi:hypothetical protein
MAFRSEVFERVGLFDTSLGRTGEKLLGGEEKDIFGRIAASYGEGVIWWVPGATIDHFIPAARVTDEHFRRLSRMVGVTARVMASGGGETNGAGLGRALLAEAAKWVATLILAAWFAATLRPSKARYLLIMRSEITKGLLS